MIQTLLRFKFWLESITESKPKEKRTLISKIILNSGKIVAQYAVYWLLLLKKKLGLLTVPPLKINPDGPIVSLTTFPARFENLWMVLYCLYQQTMLPQRIVVTLVNSEVPGGYDSLPDSLKYYSDKGVEFLFVDENLKPHNKYFYTRQKYSNNIVITVDDDFLYLKDTIERLMKLHQKYPNCICTNRGSEIIITNTGEIDHYANWKYILRQSGPSNRIIALGFAGVLYPPSFNHKELYNVNKIKRLSLSADDLWLKAMEILSDSKVVVGDYYAVPTTIPSSQRISLKSINNGTENRNDKCMKNLQNEYDLWSLLG